MSQQQPEIVEGDEESDLPPARPAATAIIFDEGGGGPPRLLMVKRSAQMAFAGGAVVFPGGRVDPDDFVLARRYARFGDDGDDLAARIACVRETLEETGLLIGSCEPLAHGRAQALRHALAAGQAFSTALDRNAITLDLAALTPFARWIPKLNNPRRFDTRFYLSHAGQDGERADLSVDERENSALFWASAEQSLAMAQSGEIEIIFPTRRNLERLAQYRTYAEALACAARHPPAIVSPWIERRGDDRFLVIPAGIGYPVTEERLSATRRD